MNVDAIKPFTFCDLEGIRISHVGGKKRHAGHMTSTYPLSDFYPKVMIFQETIEMIALTIFPVQVNMNLQVTLRAYPYSDYVQLTGAKQWTAVL